MNRHLADVEELARRLCRARWRRDQQHTPMHRDQRYGIAPCVECLALARDIEADRVAS